MGESVDANNTDSEDELEEVSDDDDDQSGMTITDCDVALQRASSATKSFAAYSRKRQNCRKLQQPTLAQLGYSLRLDRSSH